jgi:hypothetical protein
MQLVWIRIEKVAHRQMMKIWSLFLKVTGNANLGINRREILPVIQIAQALLITLRISIQIPLFVEGASRATIMIRQR